MDWGRDAAAREPTAEPVRAVGLVPVELPEDLARVLVAALSRRLSVPCHLDEGTGIGRPPRLTGREQHDADQLLRELVARSAPGLVLVGVTRLDLAIPLFTHVFGRAVRFGRAALVSLARLTPEFYGLAPDRGLAVQRGVTEILHELGHVAGLDHCRDRTCIMSFVPNVESLDLRGRGFCETCRTAAEIRLPLHG